MNLPVILQQQSLSVTLDGPRIFTAATALIALAHFSEPQIIQLLVATTTFLLFVHNDYQNFLNLGPGGTPPNFRGYVKISWFRLWTLRDPFTAPKPSPDALPSRGILARQALPYRLGPKPRVAGIAPQRQMNQHGSPNCYHALRRTMEKLSLKSPNKFGTERSCIEKHGLALFARHPVQTTCQGEICHVHNSDHSMHMCLHPDDSRELLQKGWGQRHPLAWKWWFVNMPVAPDFVMVYAPRGMRHWTLKA